MRMITLDMLRPDNVVRKSVYATCGQKGMRTCVCVGGGGGGGQTNPICSNIITFH